MNKLLSVLLSVLCIAALLATAFPCLAGTTGVAPAEERVVNLPQDQARLYISVVGEANDARYREVVGWFNRDANLMKLRVQVHFCPVTTQTAIYTERYAPNVKALPTVRMQKSDGRVIYEAAGRQIPATAAELNAALTESTRLILPWRREIERRLPAQPDPLPDPLPDSTPEPEPQPSVGPTPIAAPPVWYLAAACLALFLVGAGAGYGRLLYGKLHPRVK